nr:phosphodiester glycosidase family protein [Polyangium spumosum]
MDLQRVTIRLVAGTTEPVSENVPLSARPGLIPRAEHPDLVAAFNGGFKALHGQYGMMIEGKTFLPPRKFACTVGLYRDGSVRIGTWPALAPTEPEMAAYRQTPACLVEGGELNKKLTEYNRNWGATVSGETVIRRSAIGVDATGRTLFYALGEAVTAQSLARAIKAAGAHAAAQLDVNYAFPRFLLFDHPPGAERSLAASLVPKIDYRETDYVKDPSPRDFFYVARRHP